MPAARKKTAAFSATRLTSTVFKIVEYDDDIYVEHPFIYAKLLPSVLLLIDSGCGGASNDPGVDVTSLREFIETWSVEDNDDMPLNEHGKRKYIVVCTHCHYDHILALEQFVPDSPILASSHPRSFFSPANLPKNTQCKRLGIPVLRYTPELVAHETLITIKDASTGLRVLHTPGHTPDELALWDAGEGMLYVGDTVYEWEPVLFPPEGDVVVWFAGMDYLVDFVRAANRERENAGRPVRINAGHDTSMADALDVLLAGRAFVMDVLTGKERVKRRSEVDGVRLVYYAQRWPVRSTSPGGVGSGCSRQYEDPPCCVLIRSSARTATVDSLDRKSEVITKCLNTNTLRMIHFVPSDIAEASSSPEKQPRENRKSIRFWLGVGDK